MWDQAAIEELEWTFVRSFEDHPTSVIRGDCCLMFSSKIEFEEFYRLNTETVDKEGNREVLLGCGFVGYYRGFVIMVADHHANLTADPQPKGFITVRRSGNVLLHKRMGDITHGGPLISCKECRKHEIRSHAKPLSFIDFIFRPGIAIKLDRGYVPPPRPADPPRSYTHGIEISAAQRRQQSIDAIKKAMR